MNDEKNAIYQNMVRHYRTLARVNMLAINMRSLSKVVQEKNEEYDIIVTDTSTNAFNNSVYNRCPWRHLSMMKELT